MLQPASDGKLFQEHQRDLQLCEVQPNTTHLHPAEVYKSDLQSCCLVCVQVVDFQWNPHDPWTFMSVSDDVSDELGGGTLQLWRVNDLIYRDEAEVLAELDKHRQGLPCSSAGLSWDGRL